MHVWSIIEVFNPPVVKTWCYPSSRGNAKRSQRSARSTNIDWVISLISCDCEQWKLFKSFLSWYLARGCDLSLNSPVLRRSWRCTTSSPSATRWPSLAESTAWRGRKPAHAWTSSSTSWRCLRSRVWSGISGGTRRHGIMIIILFCACTVMWCQRFESRASCTWSQITKRVPSADASGLWPEFMSQVINNMTRSDKETSGSLPLHGVTSTATFLPIRLLYLRLRCQIRLKLTRVSQ